MGVGQVARTMRSRRGPARRPSSARSTSGSPGPTGAVRRRRDRPRWRRASSLGWPPGRQAAARDPERRNRRGPAQRPAAAMRRARTGSAPDATRFGSSCAAHPASPWTTDSRDASRATQVTATAAATAGRRARRDLERPRRQRQRRVVLGQVGHRRSEHQALEQHADERGGHDQRSAAPASSRRPRRARRRRRAARRPSDGAPAPSAHRPGSARRGRRARRRSRPRAGSSAACRPAARRARSPRRRRQARRRAPSEAKKPRPRWPRGETIAIDDGADGSARSRAARGRTRRGRRSRAELTMPATRSRSSAPSGSASASVDPGEAERLGQPEPDLGLPAPCSRGRTQRRRLEGGVVARVRDHVDRLAERERVGRLDLVTWRDRRTPAIARTSEQPMAAAGRQLVALAERAGVGLERAQPEASASNSSTNAVESPSVTAVATSRTRRAATSRAPSAGDRRRRYRGAPDAPPGASAGGDVGAAQQPARPDRRRPATPARPRRATGSATAKPGRHSGSPGPTRAGSFSSVSSRVAGRRSRASRRPRPPWPPAPRRQPLDVCARRLAARAPDRPAHPDRAEPPLDLGPRRGGQHHAGGHQRDQRQRDQQVDHDPGRLVEQRSGPRSASRSGCCAGRSWSRGPARAPRSGKRVAQPDLGEVDLRVASGRSASNWPER